MAQGPRSVRQTSLNTLVHDNCLTQESSPASSGDPIEIGALASSGCCPRSSMPICVGASKANVSHAEPAAGMVGLLKLALATELQVVAPNAQLRVLNLHLVKRMGDVACGLPRQQSYPETAS